jgi:hypothetical protein
VRADVPDAPAPAPTRTPPATNHVVLCLLALRDWTAHELAGQVRRSLRYCWPKTEGLGMTPSARRMLQRTLARGERDLAATEGR